MYLQREGILLVHVVGAMTAPLTGPWQLRDPAPPSSPPRARTDRRAVRGRAAAGGCAGLLLAPTAHGGAASSLGFGALAVCWLVTTGVGLRMALTGRYADHRC